MIELTKLWIVTYKVEFGVKKAKFMTYDNNGKNVFKIQDENGNTIEVTKEAGNDFYLSLLKEYKGKVNKIL